MTEIWEALESTAIPPSGAFLDKPHRTASPQAIGAHRRAIMRFLEEVDGDVTVVDLREALEAWVYRND